jgi:hypothetical protein
MAPSGGGSDFRLGSSLCDFRTAWVEGGLSITVGAGILKTAKAFGVGTGKVHRVKREMAAVA